MAAVPEGLEREGLTRRARSIAPREALVGALDGAGFLAAAAALALLGESGQPWRWDVGIALTLAFALTVRARFDIGTGYTPPTQLVFVPVLLVSPPQYAPLIALAGWLLGRLPDLVRGETHPSRLLFVPGNCWFAVGPALVLTLAGGEGPAWSDWPVYLLALAAQFAGDVIATVVRDRVVYGVPPALELRVLGYVWSIDAALTPIGLLAALAAAEHRFAFIAVLPLAALFVVFSTERTRRFEAELQGTRAREALLAGASHELQTPLAILSGVVDTLSNVPHISDAKREAGYETLRRQTAHLRHLVAQFVDYARIKADQELLVSPRPTDVAATVRSVAEIWEGGGVTVRVDAQDVSALVDSARLHSAVMTLVANAVKFGPPQGPVDLRCRRAGPRAVIEILDDGPGIAEERLERVFADIDPGEEGSGIGLFLVRASLRLQGGDVRLANRPEGGLVATVYLPLTP